MKGCAVLGTTIKKRSWLPAYCQSSLPVDTQFFLRFDTRFHSLLLRLNFPE